MRRAGLAAWVMLGVGLVFLYAPIASLVVYSFNNSRLVTVWDAAHSPTLRWYAALLSDGEILRAAWLSIRIACAAATLASLLGVLAGTALARHGPFRGRTLLAGMTLAPIVMPEVITGLALLLLYVALERTIGWPHGTGALTITLAHTTFCMAYVTVVVQSRLAGFDVSLEEAAMDLGARPAAVFRRITLPLIAPAVASGWLLAFTLSWDDLVISQFVAGPGSS
ncbi:MAG: ABC transporter permease subunit, partial [Steroidobacteraceae bacterium]